MVHTIHEQPPKLIIEVCVDSVESAVALVLNTAEARRLILSTVPSAEEQTALSCVVTWAMAGELRQASVYFNP